MKLLSRILLIVAILVVAGHYALWRLAAEQVETIMQAQVERELDKARLQAPDMNITVDYDLAAGGYPLGLYYNVSDMSVTLDDPHSGMALAVDMTGGDVKLAADTSLLGLMINPRSLPVAKTVQDVSMDVSISMPQEEPVNLTIDIAEGTSDITYSLAGLDGNILGVMAFLGLAPQDGATATPAPQTMDGVVHDITVYMNRDGARVLVANLDKMMVSSDMFYLNPKLVNQDMVAELSGLTIHTPEELAKEDGPESITIDTYRISARAEFWPVGHALEAELRRLQGAVRKMAQADDPATLAPIDLTKLKTELRAYVRQLADNNSNFSLREIKIAGDGFSLNASGSFSVQSDLRPAGSMKTTIKGINKLTEKSGAPADLAGQNLMLQGLMSGGPITLSVEVRDGFIVFNGMPLLPVMPLTDLIDKIPNTLDPAVLAGLDGEMPLDEEGAGMGEMEDPLQDQQMPDAEGASAAQDISPTTP